jgi:hypothetical protein
VSGWTSVFIILGLYGAFFAGILNIRSGSLAAPHPDSFPRMTFFLVGLIAVPTVMQFVFPTILPLLERNRDQIMEGGWWRIVTALMVQDGGISGSFFNLISLFFVGRIGEIIWGGRRLFVLFWLGGICSEAIALFWQPIGAGNSIANFSIAASVIVWCLARRPRPTMLFIIVLTLGAYIALFIMRDIHGAAGLIGLGLGTFFLWMDRKPR